jgi:glycosyltransferase involved in cell wall biosynthesis
LNEKCLSVIIATLNCSKKIEKTLQNLNELNNYSNIEIIVIDGRSTDETCNICKKYNGIITHFLSEYDQGIYDAWNKGVALSNATYCSFLGAGDIYIKHGLYKALSLANEEKFDIIYGNLIKSGEKKAQLKSYMPDIIEKRMNIIHIGALHHRRLFKKYGLFNATYKIAGDYEFLLRCRKGLNVEFIQQPIVEIEPDGISTYDVRVLLETAKAKINNTDRSITIILDETIIAIIKFYIKRIASKIENYY